MLRFAMILSLLFVQSVSAQGAYQTGLCDDPRVSGWSEPAVLGEGGCGIDDPVRLSSVAGVQIEGETLVSCTFARQLADWAEAPSMNSARPVISMQSSAAYVCRAVDDGDELSNHAYGMAMDITSFRFGNGWEIPVLEGWQDPRRRGFLEGVYAAACNRFDTVLGPEFNAAHADHLHVDLTVGGRDRAFCR